MLAVVMLAVAVVGGAPETTPRIVVADTASAPERTAAAEIARCFGLATGRRFTVAPESAAGSARHAVWVGPTRAARRAGLRCETMGEEEWALRSTPEGLLVAGGRPRGTLYAACRLLEDHFGVRWWSPWEETVPRRARIVLPKVHRRGRPAFAYRDVYMVEGPGAAAFCARNRLNRNGDSAIPGALGGAMDYGPPYHVHTLSTYLPPERWFDAHPDWFAEVGGVRQRKDAQICPMHPGARAEILARLRALIAESRAAAAREGRPAPRVYDISQNDWGGFCECAACKAMVEREGSQSGPMIDLLNYLADGIRHDHPDVFLDTLAYFQTQPPPRTLRPRDSVIVRLCDTGSNFARPVTDPANRAFRDLVAAWGRIAKRLRIWDYGVTYGPYAVLPFESVHTYAPDFRFYRAHDVEGVFTEFEYAVTGDLRELKLWMLAKLLEEPDRDPAALLRDFTDGYYGPAGTLLRAYLDALRAAQQRAGSFIGMMAAPDHFAHIDAAFLAQAHALFDRAERAVAKDPARLRRVRHARFSLDRATLVLARRIARAAGGRLPVDRERVARRLLAVWRERIALFVPPERRPAEEQAATGEVERLLAAPLDVPLPERFHGRPPAEVMDSLAQDFRCWQDQAKVVPDPEAETGWTARLEIPDDQLDPTYRLPMPWGVYDAAGARGVTSAEVRPEDIPGPGYHWVRLGPVRLGAGHYVWFFRSWVIQADLVPPIAEQTWEVWARVKWTGPAYPHARAGERNAICVERVVAVRAAETSGR